MLKLHLKRKSALIIYNPSSVSSTFGSAPANLTNYFCGQRQKAMRLKQLRGGNNCLEDFKCYLGKHSGKKKKKKKGFLTERIIVLLKISHADDRGRKIDNSNNGGYQTV